VLVRQPKTAVFYAEIEVRIDRMLALKVLMFLDQSKNFTVVYDNDISHLHPACFMNFESPPPLVAAKSASIINFKFQEKLTQGNSIIGVRAKQ